MAARGAWESSLLCRKAGFCDALPAGLITPLGTGASRPVGVLLRLTKRERDPQTATLGQDREVHS